MRRNLVWKLIVLALATALAPAAIAAPQPGKTKPPVYDPATVVTISGVVTGKIDVPWTNSTCWGGEHLLVKTDKETIQVHVGPTWFLLRHDVRYMEGDRVEITGSRVQVNGTDAIIARSIKRGEEQLDLRDEKGVPVWSARKK